jgi:hypothetical protein
MTASRSSGKEANTAKLLQIHRSLLLYVKKHGSYTQQNCSVSTTPTGV